MSITTKDQSIALIRRAGKILCLSQAEPRADGIAAVLAFQAFGQKMGKEVVAVLPHGVGKNLQFLPGHEHIAEDLGEPGDFVISLSTENSDVERVKYTLEENSVDILITPKNGSFNPKDVSFRHNTAHFDLIIIFDSPTLEGLGQMFSQHTDLFANSPTLNISANAATADYAKVNLVDPTKSSSCEVLFDCLYSDDEFKKSITPDSATSLLTGMVASTASFLRPNTTASSLEAAAILQELGAEQSDIIEHLFKQKSFNTLKVWGRIFSTLEIDPVHRLAWTYVTQHDLAQVEASNVDVENVAAEILRYTEDIDLAVLTIENGDNTTVQLRSKSQNLDWSKFLAQPQSKVVEHGVDITLDEPNAATSTEAILAQLIPWQQQRLGLDPSTPLQKMTAQATAEPQQTLPIETLKKSNSVTATPPANVPFVAPKQPHENTGIIPEEHTTPPGTQAAEVIIDTNEKGIPEWLKKSFPKN